MMSPKSFPLFSHLLVFILGIHWSFEARPFLILLDHLFALGLILYFSYQPPWFRRNLIIAPYRFFFAVALFTKSSMGLLERYRVYWFDLLFTHQGSSKKEYFMACTRFRRFHSCGATRRSNSISFEENHRRKILHCSTLSKIFWIDKSSFSSFKKHLQVAK